MSQRRRVPPNGRPGERRCVGGKGPTVPGGPASAPRWLERRPAFAAPSGEVVDGLGMLLHQAAPGFERWFGIRPEVDEDLRAAVLA